MIDDDWKRMSPKVSLDIRQMNVIRNNPQWWVIEVFDVFFNKSPE